MSRRKRAAVSLILVLSLTISALPMQAFASDGEGKRARSFLLIPTKAAAPIGVVESFGEMLIDGRVVYGRREIWGGELIQAPVEMGLRAQLDSIGRITLKHGSAARLATGMATSVSGIARRVLVVMLASGEVKIQLQPEVEAYVEASGSAFAASEGANFRVWSEDGNIVAEAAHGTVEQLRDPCDFTVDVIPIARKPKCGSGQTDCSNERRKGSTTLKAVTKCRFQTKPNNANLLSHSNSPNAVFAPAILNASFTHVMKYAPISADGQAQNELPPPGTVLNVRVDRPDLGCLYHPNQPGQGCHPEIQIKTRDDGTAEVAFKAKSKPGFVNIIFKGPPTTTAYAEWGIKIGWLPTPLEMLVGAAAIGVGVGVGIKLNQKDSIKPIPPPVIVP